MIIMHFIGNETNNTQVLQRSTRHLQRKTNKLKFIQNIQTNNSPNSQKTELKTKHRIGAEHKIIKLLICIKVFFFFFS